MHNFLNDDVSGSVLYLKTTLQFEKPISVYWEIWVLLLIDFEFLFFIYLFLI